MSVMTFSKLLQTGKERIVGKHFQQLSNLMMVRREDTTHALE